MTKNIQLSFSGLSASVARDGFSKTGYILEIGGAEQSHVDLANPDHIFYEYLRRIGHLADLVAPAGQPMAAAHLGAGALTLVRYVQATRPGSRRWAGSCLGRPRRFPYPRMVIQSSEESRFR